MKKNQLLAIILFCTVPFFASAKVWRVNNNMGIQADFTTVQAAHNGAAAGDTLHIEPSFTNYGNLVLSKPLTIISIGNFLKGNPGLQYSAIPGTMQSLTINAGAAGSVLSCNFSGAISIAGCNNIRFDRTYLFGADLVCNNSDSIVIIDSYFSGKLDLQNNSNNLLISNCFIGSFLTMQSNCDAVITNNIIGLGGLVPTQNIYNSIFENNILKNTQAYNYPNSIVTNNITAGNTASLPSGNNNQLGVNMTSVFVNPSGANDDDYMLINGSLASGTGVNGVDEGVFGGATPYKPGVQPAIPAIYKLTAPTTTTTNTLDIIFSTKSNN